MASPEQRAKSRVHVFAERGRKFEANRIHAPADGQPDERNERTFKKHVQLTLSNGASEPDLARAPQPVATADVFAA